MLAKNNVLNEESLEYTCVCSFIDTDGITSISKTKIIRTKQIFEKRTIIQKSASVEHLHKKERTIVYVALVLLE